MAILADPTLGERPVSIRYNGDFNACDAMLGAGEQFFNSVKDFCKAQGLPQYSNYRDLPTGGQIFAQYGPAGAQILSISVPGNPVIPEEREHPPIPKSTRAREHRKGCLCDEHDVVIYAGKKEKLEELDTIVGKSGTEYHAIEGDYPWEYSVNVFCVQPKENASFKYEKNTDCKLYSYPGPDWCGKKALFFSVCEYDKNEKAERHLPIVLPFRCAKCYEWELEPVIDDCDGQIYTFLDDFSDIPCAYEASEVGKEDFEYRKDKEKTKNFNADTLVEPEDTELAQYRSYTSYKCKEEEGIYCWYVPPKCEPRSRCKRKQKLTLKCKPTGEVIKSVDINIIYNRPVYTFVVDAREDNLDTEMSAYYYHKTTQSDPENECWALYDAGMDAIECVDIQTYNSDFTLSHKQKTGYVYCVDDEGTIYHVRMNPTYPQCLGKPFAYDVTINGDWNRTVKTPGVRTTYFPIMMCMAQITNVDTYKSQSITSRIDGNYPWNGTDGKTDGSFKCFDTTRVGEATGYNYFKFHIPYLGPEIGGWERISIVQNDGTYSESASTGNKSIWQATCHFYLYNEVVGHTAPYEQDETASYSGIINWTNLESPGCTIGPHYWNSSLINAAKADGSLFSNTTSLEEILSNGLKWISTATAGSVPCE